MHTEPLVPFSVQHSEIPGLVILRMKQVGDARGTVREVFRASAMAGAGLHLGPWTQLNVTETRRGAIRGMHGEAMTKLVCVVAGEALAVYLDARAGSPARGRAITVHLGLGTQVLVPPGVCNGFQSTSVEPTQYLYCFDQEWMPGMAGVAVHPLDPAPGVDWPIEIDPVDTSLLSAKDAAQPGLAEVLAGF